MTDVVTGAPQAPMDGPQNPEQKAPGEVSLIILEGPNSPHWEAATDVEAQAFIRRKYVASKEELAEEYAPYLSNSVIVAAEVDGKIEGMTRIINYDPEVGFKTVNDIKAGRLQVTPEGQAILDEVDPTQMAEVGTIAVSEDYLSKGGDSLRLSQHLYGAIYQMGKQHDKPWVIASFDADYYNGVIRWFGSGAREIGPAVDYMGSDTIPSVMNIQAVQDNLRAVGFVEQADAFDQAADILRPENA